METVDVNSFVTYVEEFKVLICRMCRHGLVSTGVKRHFPWRHKSIPIEVRKQIVEFAELLDAKKPEVVQVPTGEVAVIEGLDIIKGFGCGTCNALYGQVQSTERPRNPTFISIANSTRPFI
jgi:hypothetical protein